MISENVKFAREAIAVAAKKSGRTPDEVKLIGVTKTINTEKIKELLAAGVTILGENRVQEFLPKYEELSTLSSPPEWHFIGHLQKNKVKYIIDKVTLIHSVDSLPLAAEINKQAKRVGRVMDILAEVNIAEESSKFGMSTEQILDFAESLKYMPNIRLTGLMCVPPFVENAEENRVNFVNLRKIFVDIHTRKMYHTEMRDLSFGMSGDYPVAVEEGATMVRLGTALFGERTII